MAKNNKTTQEKKQIEKQKGQTDQPKDNGLIEEGIMEEVKFYRTNKEARLPVRVSEYSAGMDLSASERVTIQAKGWGMVKTGFKMELPPRTEAQVRSRSGLALKKGVFVLNSPGTVDEDYRGEIGVILANLSEEDFVVNVGDRIAQLVIADISQYKISEVSSENQFSPTERGAQGFGSSGTKRIE